MRHFRLVPKLLSKALCDVPVQFSEAVIKERSRHQVEKEVGGETTDSESKPNGVIPNGTARTSRGKRMEEFFGQKDLPDCFIHFTDEGSDVCCDMLKPGLCADCH